MKTLFALLLPVLFFFPIYQGQPGGGMSSTCNHRADEYSAPDAPPCTGIYDQACVDAAAERCKQAKAEAANSHCRRAEVNDENLETFLDQCDAFYVECLGAGHGTTYCASERDGCYDNANVNHDIAEADNDAELASANGQADSNFASEAILCCTPR